jgi:hypothetical protein
VKLHPSSVIKLTDRAGTFGGWPCKNPWLVFEDMSRRIDAVLIRNCDMISSVSVALLYGPMRMSGMIMQQMKIASTGEFSVFF